MFASVPISLSETVRIYPVGINSKLQSPKSCEIKLQLEKEKGK